MVPNESDHAVSVCILPHQNVHNLDLVVFGVQNFPSVRRELTLKEAVWIRSNETAADSLTPSF